MGKIPDSICILGAGPSAAGFALRRTLKLKAEDGALLVLDYQGRGASILTEELSESLARRPVKWYDLADRSRPTALFHLGHSSHFPDTIRSLLHRLKEILPFRVSSGTLEWAVKAADRLSESGAVGLAALHKTLSDPIARRWFLDTQNDPADFSRLLQMFAWMLRFPAVYALSEGNNRVRLAEELATASTLWIEANLEHFERYEHRIVTILVEAVVEDALKTIAAGGNGDSAKRGLLKIVHLFPVSMGKGGVTRFPRETAHIARHISVHAIGPNRPPSSAVAGWEEAAEQVWVVGRLKGFSVERHPRFDKEEEARINALKPDQLFMKGSDGKRGVVARISETHAIRPMGSHRFRVNAARSRQRTTIRQMGTAVRSGVASSDGDANIYRVLCGKESLRAGWAKVRANSKKSNGVDHVTVPMFEKNLETELERLSDELQSRSYRCRPLKQVLIPKPDGGTRELGIACVRDRVVQAAAMILLEPRFEPTFSPFSFAYRPHRNAHHALRVARTFISGGAEWAVVADIRKCFDSLDHEVLLGLLAKKIGDAALLDLIHHWLTADIFNFSDLVPLEVGVAQGSPLSPLLANVYLDPLDHHMEALDFRFVRYADDITILTRTEAEAKNALGKLGDFLANPLRLSLKPAKTHYVPVVKGFDLLGFRVSGEAAEIQVAKMDRVTEALRDQLKSLGAKDATLQSRAEAVYRINSVVRGFRNYFLLPDKKVLEQLLYLDGRVEQMAHTYLPPGIRDDPAWICRERFCAPGADDNGEIDEQMKNSILASIGGYEVSRSRTITQGWMVKAESSLEAETRPAVHLSTGEGSGAASGKEDARPEAIVEYSDRLYVLSHGTFLAMEGEELVVKKGTRVIYRKSMNGIGLLFLQGFAMNISVALQLKLADLDIPVVFSPPVGSPAAILNPIRTTRSHLRGLQVLRRNDPDVIDAGLRMLSAKVGNQAAILRYFAKYRKGKNEQIWTGLQKAADDIIEISGKIRELDPSDAAIRTTGMGYEGRAASLYWQQLAAIIPAAFGFEGRVTRNSQDAVNQALNYVYGMLYGEVWRSVTRAGLDPYFGIMHGSERNQGGLVFDLIEEFRPPFADRIVFGMLGRGFRPEIGGHGFLRTRSKRQLAAGFAKRWTRKISWRSKQKSPGEILDGQALSIARLVKKEGNYNPFRMRW